MVLTPFQQKWHDAVKRTNSILCPYLKSPQPDPYADTDLPAKGNGGVWVDHFVDATVRHSPAFITTPNQFAGLYRNPAADKQLIKVGEAAKKKGLLCIEDHCFAGPGTRIRESLFRSEERCASAVTITSDCMDLRSIVEYAHKQDYGVFITCLRESRDTMRVKGTLVPVTPHEARTFFTDDKTRAGIHEYVPQYLWLADRAYRYGADGIVCDLPGDRAIKERDVARLARYCGQDMLVLTYGLENLVPFFKYFGPDRVVVKTSEFDRHYLHGYAEHAQELVKENNVLRKQYRKDAAVAKRGRRNNG